MALDWASLEYSQLDTRRKLPADRRGHSHRPSHCLATVGFTLTHRSEHYLLGVTSRIVGSPSRANGLVSLSALAEHGY